MPSTLVLNSAVALAATMLANNPAGSPPLGGPMSHVLVTVAGDQFFVGFENASLNPVALGTNVAGFEEEAAVLNRHGFNAQYGWLVSGFWAPPPGASVWMRVIDQAEHLKTYIGRDYTVPGVASYTQFEPILGTAGSVDRFAWNGTMLHNYTATQVLGTHEATYEVYFGDAQGNVIPGSAAPAQVTLTFTFGTADPNGDGRVDIDDLYDWHQSRVDRDVDGDGAVTDLDGDLLMRTIRDGERELMSSSRR